MRRQRSNQDARADPACDLRQAKTSHDFAAEDPRQQNQGELKQRVVRIEGQHAEDYGGASAELKGPASLPPWRTSGSSRMEARVSPMRGIDGREETPE